MIKMKKTMVSHRINSNFARFDHYEMICEDCGCRSRVGDRLSKVIHWMTCKTARSVAGQLQANSCANTIYKLFEGEKKWKIKK